MTEIFLRTWFLILFCNLQSFSLWNKHPRQYCYSSCLLWSLKKIKQFWLRDCPYLTALGNKRFRSLIVADKHVWLMCMQLRCTGGIVWKSMAMLHTKKSNTQLTQKKFIFKNLVIKYETKWFIIYPKSSATYWSNRTTWIIFFLVRIEKLPVLDVRTGQVSCPGWASVKNYSPMKKTCTVKIYTTPRFILNLFQ